MKYVIVVDSSGSMTHPMWQTMVENCLMALREKFREIGKDDLLIPVYFANHQIENHVWLFYPIDRIMALYTKFCNGGTVSDVLRQIQEKEHAEVVFILSDGFYDWWLPNRSSEMFIMVCDQARSFSVRENMRIGHLPFNLLVIDQKKSLRDRFLIWWGYFYDTMLTRIRRFFRSFKHDYKLGFS